MRFADIKDGVMQCSCCAFERTSIPCVHIASINHFLYPDWNYFNHHNVALRWWSYKYPSTNGMTEVLHQARSNDIKGPSAPKNESVSNMPIEVATKNPDFCQMFM